MEELRLYTIRDLKDWLLNGKSKEGLSEAVITTTRAYSFIHNPYVTDDMPVVSALFVGEDMAAFTAAFPERLVRPDCTTHWINSLYVSPKYEGKGYALIVMGSLLECFEGDPVFDLDAMDTSVEIFKYMGLGAKTFTRYCFREKAISGSSMTSRMALALENSNRKKRLHKVSQKLDVELDGTNYRLCYDNFIDKETHDFIVTHSKGGMFLRRQETFNWMLHYPFVHEAPLLRRSNNQAIRQSSNLFSSSKFLQRYYVVKLIIAGQLAAVYIFRNSSSALSLDYFYYDDSHEQTVFLSILEHILCLANAKFTTTNSELAQTIRLWNFYPIHFEEHPAFCYSKEFEKDTCPHIQGGDGDMFLS